MIFVAIVIKRDQQGETQLGSKQKNKQLKLKNRIAYVKRPGAISRQSGEQPSKKDSTSWKLYQDCRVPLNIFLDCLFDKEYEGLILKGKPPEHEILEAWFKIHNEYSELICNDSGNELYQKTIEINYLSGKIFVVDKIVKHLQVSYNTDLVEILKYYGVACGINENENAEARYKKLEMVVARVRRWITDVDVLKKQYYELLGDQTEKKGGYEFFEDSLTNISIFRKTNVTAKDISVRQFAKALKSMEREYMRQTTKNLANA